MSTDEWRAFDRRFPAPTFFARPAWALAVARAYPQLQPHALFVNVGEREFLVPLMRLHGRIPFALHLRGVPYGYTCVLADDGSPAAGEQAQDVFDVIAEQADSIEAVLWPLSEQSSVVCPPPHAHETSVIDLGDGLDAALARISGRSRRMAGQALRRGVVCCQDESPERVDRYYEILQDSARRWGLNEPTIPRALIAGVLEYGGHDAEVWFASHEGRAVAGGVVLFGSDELFFWSAAMRADDAKLRPSNALNVALIRRAAERGKSWYNLGSSEGLPGVATFKHYLGARTIAYGAYNRSSKPLDFYRAFVRKVC